MIKDLMIHNAKEKDMKAIEAMYRKRVLYNDTHGIHQWDLKEITWDAFYKLYTIHDYYVGEYEGNIVCGMFIVNEDQLYWKDKPKNDALYLHKICVDPDYSGYGFADQLITFFIEKGRREGYLQVRLDVREHKIKLREMYERNGFHLYRIGLYHPDFTTALYEYIL